MTPHPCEHLIQAYSDDAFLARVVADFVAQGLAQGQGAVIIATPEHTEAFIERLTAGGVDVLVALGTSRMLCLDAERTLARFMVDGAPDRGAFVEIVGAALGRVRAAGYPAVRLYGEMVDLLCQRDVGATLRLEALWNEVLTDRRLSLLCAYRLDPLERPVQGLLRQVTQCHSRLLPAEHPERLEHAVDRADAEVFGAEADADVLRDLLVTTDHVLPPMSRAHATMLTLGNLSGHIASELSARARAYYRDRTNGVAT